MKEALKTFIHGGMLFEELGFRYFGPVDGHDIHRMISTLRDLRETKGPVFLHVLTNKGQGWEAAEKDPSTC